jgi:hypothetical protein
MLLDFVGLERPPELVAPGRGERFSFYHDRPGYYTESYALRDGEWMFVRQRLGRADAPFESELYRSGDVGQTQSIGDAPEREAAMSARLEEMLSRRPRVSGTPIELDERTVEHLRALGYVD